MSEDPQLLEDAAEVSAMFVEEFELAADDISSQVADIEEAALRAMRDEASVSVASEGESDDIEVAGAYTVVDLRGRFCPAWSSWGNSPKGWGVVGHYNGPPAPARAWSNPIAWIKFLSDYHARPGHFQRGWDFNGLAYAEVILGNTVFRVRNYAADLPHCGNSGWNKNSLGLHIPVGGSQRPIDAARGTLNTALRRADDHLRAMKKGRAGLKGHQEVGASNCPGPHIMAGIRGYRAGADLGNGGEKPPDLVHRVIAGSFRSRAGADERAGELRAAGFGAWVYEHEGMHRVQVASFSDKSNAREVETRLKRKGFAAFIASENT